MTHQAGGLWQHRLVLVLIQAIIPRRRHCPNVAGLLTRLHHIHDLRHALGLRIHVTGHRIMGSLLHRWIQAGANSVRTTLNIIQAHVLAVQILQHIVAEEALIAGSNAAIINLLRLIKDPQRLLLVFIGILLGNLPQPGHFVQHGTATLHHPLLIGIGVQHTRRLHHARQHGGLRHIQFLRVLTKINPGCGLYAIGVIAERHQVEIPSQHLILGEHFVDSRRHPHLPQLPRNRLLGRSLPLLIGAGGGQQ